jgi:hypothetical protein
MSEGDTALAWCSAITLSCCARSYWAGLKLASAFFASVVSFSHLESD